MATCCFVAGDVIAVIALVMCWCHCEAQDAQLSLHLKLPDNTRRTGNCKLASGYCGNKLKRRKSICIQPIRRKRLVDP